LGSLLAGHSRYQQLTGPPPGEPPFPFPFEDEASPSVSGIQDFIPLSPSCNSADRGIVPRGRAAFPPGKYPLAYESYPLVLLLGPAVHITDHHFVWHAGSGVKPACPQPPAPPVVTERYQPCSICLLGKKRPRVRLAFDLIFSPENPVTLRDMDRVPFHFWPRPGFSCCPESSDDSIDVQVEGRSEEDFPLVAQTPPVPSVDRLLARGSYTFPYFFGYGRSELPPVHPYTPRASRANPQSSREWIPTNAEPLYYPFNPDEGQTCSTTTFS